MVGSPLRLTRLTAKRWPGLRTTPAVPFACRIPKTDAGLPFTSRTLRSAVSWIGSPWARAWRTPAMLAAAVGGCASRLRRFRNMGMCLVLPGERFPHGIILRASGTFAGQLTRPASRRRGIRSGAGVPDPGDLGIAVRLGLHFPAIGRRTRAARSPPQTGAPRSYAASLLPPPHPPGPKTRPTPWHSGDPRCKSAERLLVQCDVVQVVPRHHVRQAGQLRRLNAPSLRDGPRAPTRPPPCGPVQSSRVPVALPSAPCRRRPTA